MSLACVPFGVWLLQPDGGVNAARDDELADRVDHPRAAGDDEVRPHHLDLGILSA